jgi:hypothetical protein
MRRLLLFLFSLLTCHALAQSPSSSASDLSTTVATGLYSAVVHERLYARNIRQALAALLVSAYRRSDCIIIYESGKDDPTEYIDPVSYGASMGLHPRPPIGGAYVKGKAVGFDPEKPFTLPPLRDMGPLAQSPEQLKSRIAATFDARTTELTVLGEKVIWISDNDIADQKDWPLSSSIDISALGEELTYRL